MGGKIHSLYRTVVIDKKLPTFVSKGYKFFNVCKRYRVLFIQRLLQEPGDKAACSQICKKACLSSKVPLWRGTVAADSTHAERGSWVQEAQPCTCIGVYITSPELPTCSGISGYLPVCSLGAKN